MPAPTHIFSKLRFGTSYECGFQEAWCFFSHFPEDQNCEVCVRTKMTRATCRRRTGEALPRAELFGDLITADHKAPNEGHEARNNHRYAVVVQDLATQRIQSYPCKAKSRATWLGGSLGHRPVVLLSYKSEETYVRATLLARA